MLEKKGVLNTLWEYQREKQMNNSVLARDLGVPENYIYRWKKGHISRLSLKELVEHLKIRGRI